MKRMVFTAVIVSLVSTSFGQTTAPATQPKTATATLETTPDLLNMDNGRKWNLGYAPAVIPTVTQKPAAITKEPAYLGTPVYGAFRIGNGPRAVTLCVIDEPAAEDQPGKLYVDTNQNGDLTDDGPGTYQTVKKTDRGLYYNTSISLRGSWGNALVEESSAAYTVYVYKWKATPTTCYFRTSAQTGKITLDDKTYSVAVFENNSDGLFIIPASNERARHTVDMLIDINNDGSFAGVVEKNGDKETTTSEHINLGAPFKIADKWYIASISTNGTKLTVGPAAAPGSSVADPRFAAAGNRPPVERPVRELLQKGTPAPDFTLNTPDNKPVKLSDFKGKLVIVDFWATWCVPCQVSMPGLEKTYRKIKDQGVVVLSPCVWDEKPAFDSWIKEHAGKDYNFTFVFDTAGRADNNVAGKLYGVSGIPTQYLIDREGKVVTALVGSGQEQKLAEALKAQGIKIAE